MLVDLQGPLPGAWQQALGRVEITTTLGLPARAGLRFRDPRRRLLVELAVAIGVPVTVAVVSSGAARPVRVFSGEVTGFEHQSDRTGSFTVVQAMDRGHRMMRGRRIAAHEDTTLGAVVSLLAERAGLTAGAISGGDEEFTHLCQPDVSDWEFLQILASERGTVVTVHDGALAFSGLKPASEAPVAPGPRADLPPGVLAYGRNLRSLRVAAESTGLAAGVDVRGWDPTAQEPLVAPVLVTEAASVQTGVTPAEAAELFGAGRITVPATWHPTQAGVDAHARATATDIATAFAELEAEVTGAPNLVAGAPVTLSGVGAPLEGKYTATDVTHVYAPEGGFTSRVLLNSRPVGAWSRPLGQGVAPVVPGLAVAVIATVREPAAEAVGWVRLTLPWLSDDYTTDWVRVAAHGGVVLPAVGDEVLVGFESGRLDRPFVVGRLYNPKQPPVRAQKPFLDSEGRAGVLATWENRAGDGIDLLDGEEAAGVVISDKEGTLAVAVDRHDALVRLTAGSTTVEVAKDGAVTVKAGEYNAAVDPQSGVSCKVGASEIAVSDSKVSLKSGVAELVLDSSGVSLTNGATKIVVGAAGITLAGASVDINQA